MHFQDDSINDIYHYDETLLRPRYRPQGLKNGIFAGEGGQQSLRLH